MKFSIIVVCLNPGTKLNQTLDSILAQTCPDFEVIVKDGGSRDGSIESMRTDGRIHLYQEPDQHLRGYEPGGLSCDRRLHSVLKLR